MTFRVAGVLVAVCVSRVVAQQPSTEIAPRIANPALVEVASVVRNTSTGPRGVQIRPGGSVVITNTPIRTVVEMAHRVQASQLAGGPAWIDSERYDITARSATGNLDLEGMTDVLLAVLADRFKLRTHVEKRELSVYALVTVAADKRLGPGMKPVASGCGATVEAGSPRCQIGTPPGRIIGAGVDVGILTSLLAAPLGRVVVDRTGVTGWFDVTLEFTPDSPGAATAGVPLVTALQEQLGLKIEPARAPVDVTVIDAIERPTAN